MGAEKGRSHLGRAGEIEWKLPVDGEGDIVRSCQRPGQGRGPSMSVGMTLAEDPS